MLIYLENEYLKNWSASLSVEKFLFTRLSPAKRINNGSFLLHPAICFSAKRFRPSHKKTLRRFVRKLFPCRLLMPSMLSAVCAEISTARKNFCLPSIRRGGGGEKLIPQYAFCSVKDRRGGKYFIRDSFLFVSSLDFSQGLFFLLH